MDKSQINSAEKASAAAQELFELGAEAWKKGDRGKAMSFYSRSAELNPEGPGARALEMANEIMNFYDKNQLNP